MFFQKSNSHHGGIKWKFIMFSFRIIKNLYVMLIIIDLNEPIKKCFQKWYVGQKQTTRGAKKSHMYLHVNTCTHYLVILPHRMAFFCPTLRISHRLIVKSLQLTKLKQTLKANVEFFRWKNIHKVWKSIKLRLVSNDSVPKSTYTDSWKTMFYLYLSLF